MRADRVCGRRDTNVCRGDVPIPWPARSAGLLDATRRACPSHVESLWRTSPTRRARRGVVTRTPGRASSSGAQAITWRAGREPGGQTAGCGVSPRSGVSAAYRRPQDGAAGGPDDDVAVGLYHQLRAGVAGGAGRPRRTVRLGVDDEMTVVLEDGLVPGALGVRGPGPSCAARGRGGRTGAPGKRARGLAPSTDAFGGVRVRLVRRAAGGASSGAGPGPQRRSRPEGVAHGRRETGAGRGDRRDAGGDRRPAPPSRGGTGWPQRPWNGLRS